jgi:transcriptional regulator with XRE-family HTH domain
MSENAELGRRLRDAREKYGLSQQQVADALGLPRTAVTNIETGSRSLKAIMRHFQRRLLTFSLSAEKVHLFVSYSISPAMNFCQITQLALFPRATRFVKAI